jgi:hypothetical protein
LVARLLWEQDAAGSNPVIPIFIIQYSSSIISLAEAGEFFSGLAQQIMLSLFSSDSEKK